MPRTSQNRTILAHLSTGADITPVSALVNFGVARLAARIEELRNDYGYYHLKTTMKKVNDKKYASYAFACSVCRERAAKEAARTGKLKHMTELA